MSGSTSFRFKKPINWAYAPGLTKAGADGSVGPKGLDGNSIYFIDYELNNSYNIELAQQKLENNYTLSGNSTHISEEREYHSGDIIISDSGNCYRIEKGVDPYYTFSINYIGKISTSRNSNNELKNVKLLIYTLSDCPEYPREYIGFLPNNRQFLDASNGKYSVSHTVDSYIDHEEDTEVFGTTGIWYKFIVLTETESPSNIDYTVEVKLKNNKSYHFNSVSDPNYASKQDPLENSLYRKFEFEKILEFPAPSMTFTDFDSSYDGNDITYATYGGTEPYFLSEMLFDKVHLFGNDVKHVVNTYNGDIYCSVDGVAAMKKVNDTTELLQVRSIAGKNWPVESNNGFVPAVYSTYNNVNNNIQEYDINWRGGESAFFSSQPNTARMIEFVKKADFRIIIHDKDSGEIRFVDISDRDTILIGENNSIFQ